MDVATILRQARLRAGATQAELGRRVGITPSVISAYENGTREPKSGILFEILSALGVDSLAVVSRDGPGRDAQRAAELMEVLELAAQFPARHSPTMTYPIFARPQS